MRVGYNLAAAGTALSLGSALTATFYLILMGAPEAHTIQNPWIISGVIAAVLTSFIFSVFSKTDSYQPRRIYRYS